MNKIVTGLILIFLSGFPLFSMQKDADLRKANPLESGVHNVAAATASSSASNKRATDEIDADRSKRICIEIDDDTLPSASWTSNEQENLNKLRQLLIQYNAENLLNDIDLPDYNASQFFNAGNDDITILHAATMTGCLPIIKKVIERGMPVDTPTLKIKITALRIAAGNGYIDILKFLLSKNADVNAANWNKETALHSATIKGQYQATNLLLAHGASVNAQDTYEQTCLQYAAQLGHFSIVRSLLNAGAAINHQNNLGLTALHLAHAPIMIELLLHYNADVSIVDKAGKKVWQTPKLKYWQRMLYDADKKINPQLPAYQPTNCSSVQLTFLKQITEGDVSAVGHIKNANSPIYPLHLAIAHNRKEMVQCLISQGDAPLHLPSCAGAPPLHLALLSSDIELTNLILDAIVKSYCKEIPLNQINSEGKTPLMLAAEICLPSTEPIIARLLELGVDQTGYLESLPEYMRTIIESRNKGT